MVIAGCTQGCVFTLVGAIVVYIDTTTLEAWQYMKRWYVVRSKHRNEVLLWHQLCSRGIEAYFPRVHPQGMAAPLGVVKPLFPGYMFVRVDLGASARSALLWMPGADGFVCFGGKPAFVSDSVLRGIMEFADHVNRPVQAAPSEGHDRTGTRSGFERFAAYRSFFEAHRPGRERSTAFIRFLREQQMHVQYPMTPRRWTEACGTLSLTPHASGLRSDFRNEPRWREDARSKYGEGIRLEAPREEGSPPS